MRNHFVVLLLNAFTLGTCFAKEFYDRLDRYMIACHTSDFTCFKRQYLSLRDHAYLGNPRLGVADHEPYVFSYGNSGTCIKMTGLEESELVGVGMDSDVREYTLVLELPLKLQQVPNNTKCAAPEKEFTDIGSHTGPLKKFAGNASIEVVFPYDLRKKKGQTFMILGEEGLDVILDIPDLVDFKMLSDEDREQYHLSEWAYEVVQHVNAARAFALPFTTRIRHFADRIPLDRYLLLYPEEEYTDMHFSFSHTSLFDMPINDRK